MAREIDTWTAHEIAARIAARDVSAREITEATLRRIDETEPEVNAFIHVAHEVALAEADRIDHALRQGTPLGPLAGVPVSVKDLVHVAGMPTTFGSRAFAGKIADEDAVPVARLRDAGAIVVGKTTTSEFGHKAITDGQLFGQTLNPWNRAYTSGGSSGGAAASLASRQVPLAIGSDGGGSVRIPASVCGVYGLKATLGVVPHIHAPDLFANSSFIGPMARNVDDLRLMHEVMLGPDKRDPWSKSFVLREPPKDLATLRIGYALKVGNPAVEPAVATAFTNALRGLDRLGVSLRDVDLDLYRLEPRFRALLQTGFAARLRARVEEEPHLFDRSFVQTVDLALAHSGIDVQMALHARTALYHDIEALFEDIDILVTPTLAAPSVPARTDTYADITIAGVGCGPIRAGWYPYTWPFNLTGHPAMSIPCGVTAETLPIGLQLVGPWHAESALISVSAKLGEHLDIRLPAWGSGEDATGS